MSFEDFLASMPEGDRLLAGLEEELGENPTAAVRTRDRRALGLLRNACSLQGLSGSSWSRQPCQITHQPPQQE
jgi:hypothetical protein